MVSAMQARSMDELEESLREYEGAVRSYVDEHPLTAVAAGFAAGYVLGGVLTPRLSWLALNAFGRMALVHVLRDVALGRPSSTPTADVDGGD
jgi:hypothetical protein